MKCHQSRIWTRIAVFISYDDNHYTTGTSTCCIIWWCLSQQLYNAYTITHMQIQADFVVSDTKALLISWYRSMATRGERHNSQKSLLTILCWPCYADHPQREAHLVMFKISIHLRRSRPEKLNCRRNDRKLNSLPQWSNLNFSTDSFSKSSNSQDHLFWAWHHLHSSLISCLEFIMTMVIVISFAHERKTIPNDYTPEFLTRIVQSPTKLNDTIWNYITKVVYVSFLST